MALEFKRTVGGVGRKLEKVLLADSQTVEVGDLIETYTTGEGVLATAGHFALGVVDSLCDASGLPIVQDDPVAGTASGSDLRSIATSTDGIYYAMVDVSRDTIYSAAMSAAAGTTASSDLRGCHIDIDSAASEYGQVLETTATRTEGVEANFYSHGLDPNDSARMLVSIAMHEFQTITT